MIRRFAEQEVLDALGDTPVVLIHGPRQAGKSTLSRQIEESGQRTYVTLDDPIPRQRAQSDPAGFLKDYGWPLTIDEIQRVPELFLAIKASVDRERVPGKYLLTGSANVLVLPKIADSLAGRMAIVDLLPLSQGEMEGKAGTWIDSLFSNDPIKLQTVEEDPRLLDRLARGGFPEPSMRDSATRRESWFSDYIRTLLDRDVRDLANIEALSQLPRLLSLLAARAGATLNVISLARDTGIPNTTLHRYLDLLKALFLIQLVPAWSSNLGTRLTKSPKAYLVDTGLLCYLDNVRPAALEADRYRLAPILENFVALELKKMALVSEIRPTLMHLRTVKHLEVDFVLEARGGAVVGIDVKASATLTPSDAEGLRYLRELAGTSFQRGVVLYTGNEVVPLDDRIIGVPIQMLWKG